MEDEEGPPPLSVFKETGVWAGSSRAPSPVPSGEGRGNKPPHWLRGCRVHPIAGCGGGLFLFPWECEPAVGRLRLLSLGSIFLLSFPSPRSARAAGRVRRMGICPSLSAITVKKNEVK